MAWEKLLSPLRLGRVEARNRFALRPHRTNLARNGRVSDALTAYYRERAKGGCGTIVVGELSLHPNDRPYEKMLEVYASSAFDDLRHLLDPLHAEGSLVFAQLNHRGFQSQGTISRLPLWGPVALADVVHGETCLQMEAAEIAIVKDSFAECAELLKRVGFDGLEVSIGSDSLLRQFLSPLTNTRGDEYGGDLTARLRFPVEVLRSVRETVGEDYPTGVRLCLDEMFYGAMTAEESISAAQEIEKQGLADFFSTTIGTYYNLYLSRASMHHPVGLTLDKVAAFKQAINVPVAAGNRIEGPEQAERIVQEGKADFISWSRPLICDPELPNKLMNGREDEIIHCVYDNQNCVGRTARDRTIGCIQNPRVGREKEGAAAATHPAKGTKNVVVVGAGPAGLEAAYIAASRGHNVTLFERAEEPGGQIRWAAKQPGRSELSQILGNLVHRLQRTSVTIEFNRDMDAKSILSLNPDAVIVATGSSPKPKPVPGDYAPPDVVDERHVLDETYPIGDRVLLIDEDGHHKATATAELLADRGKMVDMVASELFIGLDLAPIGDLYDTRQRLITKGVSFHCNQIVTEINGRIVQAFDKFTGARKTFDGYDTIVHVMGNIPDDDLYGALKGRVPAVYRAGDCVAPRRIDSAILEGNRVAMRI